MTLDARLVEVESALKKLKSEMRSRPPALGGFHDATVQIEKYERLYDQQLTRINRLKRALLAARTATGTILENYRTTEARNAANSSDIADLLGGVDTALKNGTSPNV
ncbi:hypothetical protein [Melissospora conviva]|uniref:hypothetical protein n=1 Tax=Melissospora conviva TaxID=3388432 RepID=UPI003C25C4E5